MSVPPPPYQRTATTQSGEEASPVPQAEPPTTSSTETETASQRRHRRRRERARALEVSVRPTTLTSGYDHAGSSDGYAGDGDGDADSSRVDGGYYHDDDGVGVSVVVAATESSVGGSVVDVEEVVSGSGGPILPVLTYSSSIDDSVYVAEADTPTTTVNFIAPGFGEGVVEEEGDLTPTASTQNYYVPFTCITAWSSTENDTNYCKDSTDESGDDGLSVTVDLGEPSADCMETFSDSDCRDTVATICAGPVTCSSVATNTRSFGKANACTSPPRF